MKNIENIVQTNEILNEIFKLYQHIKHKRNEQLSYNKTNIKTSLADLRIRSPVAWVLGKYAMHCDTMIVWSAALKAS